MEFDTEDQVLFTTFPGGWVVGGSVTAEILLTLSLCGGGGWWIKVIFVSNPTLVMLG